MIKAVCEWWPNRIFYEIYYVYYTIGGKRECNPRKKFTKLGLWFYNKPPILEILKLPYYFITIPVCTILHILYGVYEILFIRGELLS